MKQFRHKLLSPCLNSCITSLYKIRVVFREKYDVNYIWNRLKQTRHLPGCTLHQLEVQTTVKSDEKVRVASGDVGCHELSFYRRVFDATTRNQQVLFFFIKAVSCKFYDHVITVYLFSLQMKQLIVFFHDFKACSSSF